MDVGVFVPIAGMAMVTIVTVSLVNLATKWLELRKTRAPESLAGIEERLNRIEQAVDAIAIETERVSESQRFVTRLLAERGQSAVPPAQPRGRD